GLSKAKELSGDNSKVIALIGDGAFTGGMVYEALNNLEKEMTNLIVILNDNSMSISKNVGTVASYLLRLRTNKNYGNLKKSVQTVLDKTPVVGPWMKDTILKSKSIFRRSIYGGTFFEELGFNYVGPVDGHNLPELCQLLENVRDMQGPILVHAITTKGKGFALAEKNPGAYHGVGSFDLELGNPDISEADSFSNVFGHELCAIADTDSRVCAVTAAMKYGTGLQYFYKKHKQRFFDVGIAEEHAVTFCAGLSRGGKKPVFAVYSSFMQRCVDQLIHDISLSGMDFLLAVDRSGLVGEDGETHQGVFDAAILSEIRALTVVSPSNYSELRYWTRLLVDYKGPAAIRYPRGHEDEAIVDYISTGNAYDIITENKASKALFVTYGREFADVVRAAKLLSDMKIKTDILKLNVISPIDMNAVELARGYSVVFFAEEGVKNGGINEHFLRLLCFAGFKGKYVVCAIDNPIIAQASICEQKKAIGLDCDSLAKKMKEEL
ncbi:MAG: 1-deoxy-D-xylulose-5-phosphate synthase N-terminal domain-containing protein, partial [Oscillospiraceae bacterium]